MINDPRFAIIFNDCIDRLAGGATIEDCLNLYPEYRRELSDLLSAGLAVRRMRANPQEVIIASRQIDGLLQAALSDSNATVSNVIKPYRLWLRLAALIIILVGAIALFGLSRFPQDRASQIVLTPYPTKWVINTDTPTPILTLTATHTVTATISPTATMTVTATWSPTHTPTSEPIVVVTALPTPTSTATEGAAQASEELVTPTPACKPVKPNGWVRYTIQASDTLFDIALSRNITLERLIRVNCIQNPALIRVGKVIWVPPTQNDTIGDGEDEGGPTVGDEESELPDLEDDETDEGHEDEPDEEEFGEEDEGEEEDD